MTETLVLGNGISRLSFDKLIREWPGEVWGCNRAYLEFPDKLARLTGHTEVLIEARKYRNEHRLSFELWGGHLGHSLETDKAFTCPHEFRKDSGTTLVAQALHEGKNVAVCGFDLGGPDIHSPGIEKQSKHQWVERWRAIVKRYGSDRIRFIGFDHMPYILSGRASQAYANRYRDGKPHIIDDDYIEQWEKWSGKKARITGREYSMVKVRFKKNGFESVMSDEVAEKYAEKKKVEIIGKVEAPKREAKTEKKAEPKKAEK